MAWNPPATPPTASPSLSSLGSSPPRSRATRDLVAQVARDAVVESLRTEMGMAKRESLFASTELVEVREACRSEVQRYEQDKQRLGARLRSQKTRLDELLLSESQARQKFLHEKEEKQRLELRLKSQGLAFEEERLRERNGARKQLELLQQRCLQAAEDQIDLQQSCAKELDAIETVEIQAAEKQAALEMKEKDMFEQASKITIARKNSQVALETESALSLRLAYAEQELSEMGAKVRDGDEEARQCSELRFELLHAVHHELPSERSRVSELEERQQAAAERIREVCEAEISDLPPNLLEKVQSAIRRHEAWLSQWPNGHLKSPGGKRESGFSDRRSGTVSNSSGEICSLTSATTRYEAVLGALAQCAGASARENIELKARLATPTADEDQTPPEIHKQLIALRRELAKLREENRELNIQRQIQEDAANRLRRDMQSLLPSKEDQILQLQRPMLRRLPGTDLQLHTENRRKVKVLDAEMQSAERQAEYLGVELVQQEHSHTEVVEALQQEVANLQMRCSDAHGLRRELRECELQNQEASAENSKSSPGKLNAQSCFTNNAQRAEMERRIAVIQRRLEDLAGGRVGKGQFAERELERELLRLCERLNHEVAAGRRERRTLAEDCRLKEIAVIEWEHRCMELENTLRLRDHRLQEGEERTSKDALRHNPKDRIIDRLTEESFENGSRRQRLGGRRQLDQRRRAAKESMELSSSGGLRSSGSRATVGDDRKPVAALLQRWVKGAIERQDAEVPNSQPSSPSSSSVSPGYLPEAIERKPVANLLQRWVTKALENDEDRAASESPTLKKQPVDRQPVQALLSRWVKKAVDSQEDEDFDAEHVQEGCALHLHQETPGARSSPEEAFVDMHVDVQQQIEVDSPESPERPRSEEAPLTPRSPSTRSWHSPVAIDCGSPASNREDERESPQDTNLHLRPGTHVTVSENSSAFLEEISESMSIMENLATSSLQSREGRSNSSRVLGRLHENDRALPDLEELELTSSSVDRHRLAPVAEESNTNSPMGFDDQAKEAELEATFQHAEALCDAQHYNEALPIFQDLLLSLQGRLSPAMRSLEAEVRAHMGVTLQSLGRVEEAIEAYSSAVRKDPSLHVCHANLAQLYAYLEDPLRARLHLNSAIRLNPSNSMYLQLDEQFRAIETPGTLRM